MYISLLHHRETCVIYGKFFPSLLLPLSSSFYLYQAIDIISYQLRLEQYMMQYAKLTSQYARGSLLKLYV